MLKRLISVLVCMILVCTIGIACSQSSENTETATDSPSELNISPNAILAEGLSSPEIYEADNENPSIIMNVDPYIPNSLSNAVIGEDDQITVSDRGISTFAIIGEDDQITVSDRGISTFAIIGEDNRITVSDYSVYPFSAIAHMIVGAKCGCSWECNGFMVGPRGLVTAAHCLVCAKHHAPLDKAVFYFGTESNYIYKYDGSFYYWYGTDFTENGGAYSNEWDYGYVLFDSRVGDTTGWFGVDVLSDDQITRKYLTVAGYRLGVLKYDSSFASVYSPNVISFTADAVSGNDGAPVFYYEDNVPYVTAIYVSSNQTSNMGRRITNDMFIDMKNKSVLEGATSSDLAYGYYEASLKGHAAKTAYIDKINVADNKKSITFYGVFKAGLYKGADMQLTDYMTLTVFPDKNTVYVGKDEGGAKYYSEDEFIRIIQSFNGLGLGLTVDNGTLVKAELIS